MTAADITKWASLGPVLVSEIFGYNNQGTDLYIQLHESPVVANGDVPKEKSLLAQTNNGFKYPFPKPIALSELTIAVSTTEANLTKVGAAGGLDMTVVVSGVSLVDGTEVVSGDLATGADALTPTNWTDAVASVGKRLLRVDYTNNDGADRYLMLFAKNPANGDTPLLCSPKVAAGGTLSLRFGTNGRGVAGAEADGTKHYGCFLAQSTTADKLTATATAASYIRSIHR